MPRGVATVVRGKDELENAFLREIYEAGGIGGGGLGQRAVFRDNLVIGGGFYGEPDLLSVGKMG